MNPGGWEKTKNMNISQKKQIYYTVITYKTLVKKLQFIVQKYVFPRHPLNPPSFRRNCLPGTWYSSTVEVGQK